MGRTRRHQTKKRRSNINSSLNESANVSNVTTEDLNETNSSTSSVESLTRDGLEQETAMVSLKPPPPLELKQGEDWSLEWKRFLTRYEWFEAATEQATKNALVQVATFMSVIGNDAISIYESFTLTDAEKKMWQK